MLSGSRPHTRIYDNGLLLVQLTTVAFFVTSTVPPTALGQTFVRRKCPSVKTETTHGLLFCFGRPGSLDNYSNDQSEFHDKTIISNANKKQLANRSTNWCESFYTQRCWSSAEPHSEQRNRRKNSAFHHVRQFESNALIVAHWPLPLVRKCGQFFWWRCS